MEELRIIDKWEKSRKAVKLICLSCKQEFVSRYFSNKKTKFCSQECAYKERSKLGTTEVNCSQCGAVFLKKNSHLVNSKSGLFFCSRLCKDLGQKLSSNLQAVWPDHYGSGYKALVELTQCSVCGIADYWKLSIHHIDGNHKNNVVENLEVVCLNCHATRHSKLLGVNRVVDYKFLTPKEEVAILDRSMQHGGMA